MAKPLITIQCGNYSNYIGSHFWNLQESAFVYSNPDDPSNTSAGHDILEVDNDILYREGLTLNKEVTFTPRLISVDLKGSLGALPECGELYGKISIPKEESLTNFWTGGHQIFREEPYVKNEFLTELEDDSENVLSEKDVDDRDSDTNTKPDNDGKLYNLEDSINFWSDYLGARYHPRSILLCESFQHKNTMHPFDVWSLGRQTWSDSCNLGENMEDRIRTFAEECDHLGGFQLISDYQDGFGGVSSCIVDLLSDEYNNKSVLSFPTSQAQFKETNSAENGVRLAGAMLTLSKHLQQTGLVSPTCLSRDWFPLPGHVVCLPHVSYNGESSYSSSSLLALALDTATLQFRKKNSQLNVSDICSGLGINGRKLGAISVDLPMQMSNDVVKYFESGLLTHPTPLTPGQHRSDVTTGVSLTFNSLISIRGMKSSALFSKRSQIYNPCPDASSYIESCVANSHPGCRALASFATRPIMTGKPFPHIFNKYVNSFGEITSETRQDNLGVQFSTAMTSWSAGPSSSVSLKLLLERVGKIKLSKLHRLVETGVDDEEWEESIETLKHQLDNFSEEENY